MAKYIEYTKGAVPVIENMKPTTIDSGGYLKTPNLYARYLQLRKNEVLEDSLENSTSHEFFVLKGSGQTIVHSEPEMIINWNKGDVFIIPYQEKGAKHISFEDNILIFKVDDSPLLNYLFCKPLGQKFLPTHFLHTDIMREIEKYSQENSASERNRNGVLLTTEQMMNERLNTITHTLWSLYNKISPNSVQEPHRHNSVAIDLCIEVDEEASQNGLVYTLMGKDVDENNKIVDPIKMTWKKNNCFTTPPGWWHSHHNESQKPAWVFPIQDAGLHTYMQTLDISFSQKSK